MKKISAFFFILLLAASAKSQTPCVNKVVYAFQNVADGFTNKYTTVNWSLLTHFGFNSVDFTSSGSLNTGIKPAAAMVNMAHSNGVKVTILIWSPGNTSIVDNVLASSAKMQTLINDIKTYMQTNNLDGVNIDFENVPVTNSVDQQPNKPRVLAFAQALYNALKLGGMNYHISWSVPYTKECQFIRPVWDFAAMAPYVDVFTVMSYDYIAGNTGWTGSIQPFAGGPMYGSVYGSSANKKQYNFQNTAAEFLAAGVPASKIIMGEGFYGDEWSNLSSAAPGVMGASGGTTLNYNKLADNAAAKGKLWSAAEQTHYYAYQSAGKWVQGFYDSDSTLGIKLDHIKANNLGGLMIWALYYDSTHVELWNKIRQKFCPATGVNESIPRNTFTVFPNPMNGSAVIYSEQKNCSVSMMDAAGNVVRTFSHVDQFPFTISKGNLAPGIYMIELRSENKIERTKLAVN